MVVHCVVKVRFLGNVYNFVQKQVIYGVLNTLLRIKMYHWPIFPVEPLCIVHDIIYGVYDKRFGNG